MPFNVSYKTELQTACDMRNELLESVASLFTRSM